MCRCWDTNRPVKVEMTSTPGKWCRGPKSLMENRVARKETWICGEDDEIKGDGDEEFGEVICGDDCWREDDGGNELDEEGYGGTSRVWLHSIGRWGMDLDGMMVESVRRCCMAEWCLLGSRLVE
ncbi:unnamed protein product [Dovyalis caffra]|uniref:Uncharacterized protein n=1 Tax=Dovyalis caffra TaxID=77055 RepID=A0AAV1RBC8_9ROSI|nr:unnamed protein product [Dovyalis caffra]